MKCNQHSDNEATGLCKHCHRFTCHICAIDTGWGIVCSTECADELEVSRKIVAASKQAFAEKESVKEIHLAYLAEKKKFHSGMITTWLMGLIISLVKSVQSGNSDYAITFSVIFSILLLGSGIKVFIDVKAIKKLIKEKTS